jgi:DNA-binding NarL/FixJ family response regulator
MSISTVVVLKDRLKRFVLGSPGHSSRLMLAEVLAFTGEPASREDPKFTALSPREREILLLLSRGYTNAQIGGELFISEKTVRNHVTKIFGKLGVRTRAQAIVLAKDGKLAADEQPPVRA